ncbi:hypothetical protein C7C46_26380 [Streptomyces tateyamensis]|uniref:Uncharacterized protein n=1 Tax=Streptomyces tateyamensis TaxID=565073 RepID=A0A2V4N9Y2_9ACTN|nr:hypothetical protein C7C46_26380 [Streptomyces tateyamensis]
MTVRQPRSARLRSTQNSLPSGSARVAQPVPSGLRWSATRVAPRASRRATSSSRVRSCGWRSRWTRFLTVFGSGTVTNSSAAPGVSSTASGSPGWSSSCSGASSAAAQKEPSA